jgi:ABC-type nickel/cobalt efflux system permease component RcnA
MANGFRLKAFLTALTVAGVLLAPRTAPAHPLGNFSISRYTGIRVEHDRIELRYFIDMAEIPTFQEIQETGIVPEVGHPGLPVALTRKAESWKKRLLLEINGRRVDLQVLSKEVIFPPGAGGLPTMKVGIVYRAALDSAAWRAGANHLRYRDDNFPDRAGWREIIAVGGDGVTLVSSSVPNKDRSGELADYPTDLLNSPPQDFEARVTFTRKSPLVAAHEPVPPRANPTAQPPTTVEPLKLQSNSQTTPRNAFTELITSKQRGFGMVVMALAIAAALGAFHALEPGHGKTMVAAYLVGSRGTAWHAIALGLIVTASHTAGVYVLGGVIFYASQYVSPESLYPWLGFGSGLTVAALGLYLFLRRYAEGPNFHSHSHRHEGHHHSFGSNHEHVDAADGHHPRKPDAPITVRELVALGVSGGIIPCPAALVVLLSALSLRRVGFGLMLIVAFSVGLAAVLVAIGILTVYARRLMSRFQEDGPVIARWLPLTSAAIIACLGIAIAVQGLANAGVLQMPKVLMY